MTSAFLYRILERLERGGGRPAFVHRDTVTTYRETHGTLLRLHGALAHEGVTAGDLVAVLGGNRPESVLVQLAAQLRGADVLQVNASASRRDRHAALHAAGATTLVVDPWRDEGEPFAVPRILSLGPSERDTPDLLARESTVEHDLPASVRAAFPSGGTTGVGKLIAHRGIYDGMAHIFAPGPDGPNRVLVVAPVSHLTGNCSVLGALLSGDTVVLHEGFDADTVLRAIERERVTHLSLTPPRLAAVLDHPDLGRTRTTSVRRLSVGASPLPAARLERALDVFGQVVGQGYGLTEAPMIASIDPAEYVGHPERLASVGRIVPGMEAQIDPANGEVLVRGLALMEGYVGAAGADPPFEDGWLRTGDAGRLDADGYLYLSGRLDDVIVTGEHGSKVYPATVEGLLTTHPAVREAAVFGDGELIRAVVVAEDSTAEQLRAHVLAESGQAHLVPASIEFAGALPLTAVGKVDRNALRRS